MLTIAWDVDDVLNDLTARWFERWRAAHPDCHVGYDGLRENPPEALLGVSKADYLDSLDQFRRAAAASPLRPRPELLEWFERTGGGHRHVALSAVPLEFAHLSAAWVTANFGKWIRSFNFVPSFRAAAGDLPDYFASKRDFLQWFGKVDLLVEDSGRNAAEAQGLGIKAVLFPQPWNIQAGEGVGSFLQRLDLTLADIKGKHDD